MSFHLPIIYIACGLILSTFGNVSLKQILQKLQKVKGKVKHSMENRLFEHDCEPHDQEDNDTHLRVSDWLTYFMAELNSIIHKLIVDLKRKTPWKWNTTVSSQYYATAWARRLWRNIGEFPLNMLNFKFEWKKKR